MTKINKKHKKKKNTVELYKELYSEMDGTFAFIAGHISGGAPYGLTWEQAGIDSDLPFEEKVRLYREQISGADILSVNEEDELPFD